MMMVAHTFIACAIGRLKMYFQKSVVNQFVLQKAHTLNDKRRLNEAGKMYLKISSGHLSVTNAKAS